MQKWMDGWIIRQNLIFINRIIFIAKRKQTNKKKPEIGSSIPITLHKTRGLKNRWIIIGQNYLNFYKQAKLFLLD